MIIFIDTNTFLYHQSVEKIDFPEFLDTETVQIIIPRAIIRKLDKEKNKNHSPSLRTKAKKVLDYFEKIILSKDLIRENVSLQYYRESLKINAEKIGLNIACYDDVFLASIIQYRLENPGQQIALIAEDSDIRLHAAHFHIQVYEMPEKYRLPLEFNFNDVDNMRLKKELEQIKNSISNLFYYFSDYGHAASQPFPAANGASGFYANRPEGQQGTCGGNVKSSSYRHHHVYGQVLSFQQKPDVMDSKRFGNHCKKLDAYA